VGNHAEDVVELDVVAGFDRAGWTLADARAATPRIVGIESRCRATPARSAHRLNLHDHGLFHDPLISIGPDTIRASAGRY
jgi:hypothetical protein